MIRLEMLSTVDGSVNGRDVETYASGQFYDLPDTPGGQDLAAVFLREGWARLAEVAPPVVPVEVTSLSPVRCAAVKRDGQACERDAREGFRTCWSHRGQE